MRFTEELRQSTRKSWEMSLNHPFVLGIASGELPLEKFRYYILQDIYYLQHYGKIHAMAAAQAEDFHVTSMLAEKAKLTAEAELTVHQEHAKILHITEEDLANFKPAPTAYAYTSHLYRAALSGNLGETIAAMLPCYWLYADIGRTYRDAKPQQSIYQNWIQTYASDWFQTSTQEQIDLLDRLAEEASDKEREKMMEQFIIAKEYELAFWEMAYSNETWFSNRDALHRSNQS
ncbi:thiaminase II [Kroppenstedtia eburnea]|uniref:Aminopyrimidine aminohydrolase n=1 Tax=Kroppenstedtia eburnea TaxID=714067 RepID=A0A1N7MEA8_9BACL|nr:thiaminase II [Kroppenstedtia eburnea]EGK07243.1 thiaminase-2 [Desmospora sp. 8437]QKI81520.1 thiaminase II [Kroppenstedtia eburnea]SIS84424.1 thiaminase /4-amino-5-aminomethyl-2-methylpyrimidine deaminase [Kroppenstedtia eburnea]